MKFHHHFRTFHNKAFINNQWVNALSQKTFPVMNPATSEPIGCVPDMNVDDTQHAIEAAQDAFQIWKHTTGQERSFYLRNWYNYLSCNKEGLAQIILQECGKPIKESEAEIQYGNSFIEFFSNEARRIHGEILSSPVPDKKIFVEKQPIGVVALITPWNFPYALVARKASAALAAGCTCVVKPAEDTPFSALTLAEMTQAAGFPDGVFNVVTSSRENTPKVGSLMCTSPLVAGISFTGSTNVGKILYKQCSSGIKRLGLELGGDAPFIVYASADVDKAVKGAMSSKFRSCGQTCVASNRFFIHCSKYDEFCGKLLEQVSQLKIGDLQDRATNIGPLINQAQYDKVSTLVQDAVSKGARVLTGGTGTPLLYQPTVLADVTPDMQIYKKEVFGPVVNLLRFKDEEESVCMANDTLTGLAGYIFSEDVAQIFRVTKMLEVGMCGVNEGAISMAEIPFGGVKESGIGREGSHYGIDDYTYMKYICIGSL
ncbi:succinate-semialdehyde dehydrogenase, mitochondrial-like [Zophobas morio]|uniref:succinate-semialdehyde dehydrogenase, mitochondrial-like n=1 Tax=Zophobas morio TaxID=2755281 RepID=UPI003083A539